MSISPEGQVAKPEEKKKKLPTWTIILMIVGAIFYGGYLLFGDFYCAAIDHILHLIPGVAASLLFICQFIILKVIC